MNWGALFETYRWWAETFCAPIYWRDENNKLRNASMTFVQTNSGNIIGVTNWHVAEELQNSPSSVKNNIQVGFAPFELNRYIAKHSHFDLATFQLSDVFLTTAKKSATHISSRQLKENDALLLGGYPALRVTEKQTEIEFTFAWFACKAINVSEKNISLVLDIENSIATSGERIISHSDLGGWSGGPVFHAIDSNLIERIELVGVIYEYGEDSEIVIAHPLNCIQDDGTFYE